MATKHMKRRSTPLAVRETHIKASEVPPPTHWDGTIIKKEEKMSIGKDAEKLEPCRLMVRMENGAATVENCMVVSQKIETRITV